MTDLPYRPAARVVLLNPQGAVLLLRFTFAGGDFWVTPGGALDPGEDFTAAARRELAEETGLKAEIGDACIHELRFEMSLYGGERVAAHERFFAARTDAVDIAADQRSDLERDFITGHRWWSAEEIRTTAETIYPAGLADIIERLGLGR